MDMEEHEEVLPSEEEAQKITTAVDTFMTAIRNMGDDFGAILAVSAPGDACMVACQAPGERTRVLQLVPVIVSWLAAQMRWSEDDVQIYTDHVAEEVKRHIQMRARVQAEQ